MDFTEVVAEVIRITNRPDKLLDVRRAVNSAINFCCIESDFARDFDELSITIDSALYIQSVNLSEFERWRKFVYLRPSNRTKFLQRINPAKAFMNGGSQRCDSFYIAGDTAVLNLKNTSTNLIAGWMKYPPILTDASPDFWLLEISPFMIIDHAAATIFRNIGNPTDADKHMALFVPSFTSAQRDYQRGAL